MSEISFLPEERQVLSEYNIPVSVAGMFACCLVYSNLPETDRPEINVDMWSVGIKRSRFPDIHSVNVQERKTVLFGLAAVRAKRWLGLSDSDRLTPTPEMARFSDKLKTSLIDQIDFEPAN